MIRSSGQDVGFAPQALAETTPQFANGFFYAQSNLELSGKQASYGALYRAQPSIASLVDKVANAASRLSLRVWDLTPTTGKVEESATAFARLMNTPCQTMSPFNFWRWTVSTYEIYGEAFWLKVRDGSGAVVDLFPMHPSRISVERDEYGDVWYLFTIGVGTSGMLKAPAADVVPFLRYNPDTTQRGMSRLEPLRSTLLNEDASRRATASWWQRGARPSVALRHPKELSQGAQDRLRAAWESRHAGADLMGGTAILEEGMEAQVIQLSAEEMQYIESRKLNMQEACMVYDVPPPVIHILDHATFSNITEQMRSMYRDTMAPRLEDIESVIDFYLRPEFYADGSRRAKFALDEVLRGDFETRATAVGALIEKGVFKPSEARPLFDLPAAGPEADLLYGNAALVPLGTSVHGQEQILPSGVEVPSSAPMGLPKPINPAPVVAPLPAPPVVPAKSVDVRAVMGAIGRKAKTLGVSFDPADVFAWLDENEVSIRDAAPAEVAEVWASSIQVGGES